MMMKVEDVVLDVNMEELVSQILLSKQSEEYLDTVKKLTIFQQVQLIESLPAEIRLNIWYCIDPHNWWSLIGYLQAETSKNLIRSLPAEERLKLQKGAVPAEVLLLAEKLPKSMIDAIMDVDSHDDEG